MLSTFIYLWGLWCLHWLNLVLVLFNFGSSWSSSFPWRSWWTFQRVLAVIHVWIFSWLVPDHVVGDVIWYLELAVIDHLNVNLSVVQVVGVSIVFTDHTLIEFVLPITIQLAWLNIDWIIVSLLDWLLLNHHITGRYSPIGRLSRWLLIVVIEVTVFFYFTLFSCWWAFVSIWSVSGSAWNSTKHHMGGLEFLLSVLGLSATCGLHCNLVSSSQSVDLFRSSDTGFEFLIFRVIDEGALRVGPHMTGSLHAASQASAIVSWCGCVFVIFIHFPLFNY